MSQVDTAHAWWSRLRHQGLLLSPVVMLERYPSAPEPAPWSATNKLRDAQTRFARQGRRRGGTEPGRSVDPRLGRCPARWIPRSQVGSGRPAERHPGEAHRRRPHRQPLRDDPPTPGRLCRCQRHRARPAGHGRYLGSGRSRTGTQQPTPASWNFCGALGIAWAC